MVRPAHQPHLIGHERLEVEIRVRLVEARHAEIDPSFQDPVAAVEQVVSMHAGQDHPTLLLYRIRDENRRLAANHSVTLIASPQFALTQSLHPNPTGTGLLELLEPDDFREQSRKVWNEGIEIDEAMWTRLKALADRMLVEESDESRRCGAGEQAD